MRIMTKTIIVDSREHNHAIQDILNTFNQKRYKHISSKLPIGDYALLTDMSMVIDRKQNLSELCGNVGKEHDRFRREILRAKENGIKLVFLCEHGKGIKTLDDVLWWENPRETVREKINGVWTTRHQKVMQGITLYKILTTLRDRYGVEFLFCDKKETGSRIIELLEAHHDSRGNKS